MPLSLFVAVNNHFRTRLVAQALVNDETKETYEWLLTCTLKATNYAPRVFITDADPGMDAAIDIQYSRTYPLHCLYHISQNLIRNLKASLGNTYNDFLKDFHICRNILSPVEFDSQWHNLVTTYSKAANYLNSELYPSKERWAKAYTTKFFTAGISSTSRVESENAVIKNVLRGRPSLCELAAILDL
ncbi:4711_t:CDS:1, partial [Ambispora gerdemannii]